MFYWNNRYAWRGSIPFPEKDTSAADVIRYEQKLGNQLDIPSFLLQTLELLPAAKIMWVYRTKQEAKQTGEPYKVVLDYQAIVLTTDTEEPLGYLLLLEPDLLNEDIQNRLFLYRGGF